MVREGAVEGSTMTQRRVTPRPPGPPQLSAAGLGKEGGKPTVIQLQSL